MSLRTVPRHGACAECVDAEWDTAEARYDSVTESSEVCRGTRVVTLAAYLAGEQAGWAVDVDAHEADHAGDTHRGPPGCVHMASELRGEVVVDTPHPDPLASVVMAGMHSPVLPTGGL